MQCPACKTVVNENQKYCKVCALDLTQADFSSQQMFAPNAPNFTEMPSQMPVVDPTLSTADLFTVGAPPAGNFPSTNVKIAAGVGLGAFVLLMGVLMLFFIRSPMNSGMSTADISSTNANANVSRTKSSYSSNTSTPYAATNSKTVSSQKTGRLVTDLNIRDAPNKEAFSLGIHFMNAKVHVTEETSYELEGKVSTWYRVRITDYGCSKDANLGCGKNSPGDSDEGWVNAKYILLD